LRVEILLQAIENVVSRNRDQKSAGTAAGTRQVFRSKRVYVPRFFMIGFATVNVRPGGTVDHRLWASIGDHHLDPVRIGDVERLMIVSENLITLRATMFGKCTSDEAAGASD
jgi:hypothetical protein